MATVLSRQFAAPKAMPGDGRAVYISDSAANAGALAASDTLEFTIPAGAEVNSLRVLGTVASAGAQVGYQPLVAGEFVGSANYFGTVGIAAAGAALVGFKPIKFERDAKIVITLANALAAGEVTVVAGCNAIGVK
jgi:hypothetical protein